MFTGLIQEKGKIKSITKKSNSAVISILANAVISDVKIGDSIAVDGVCLTVVKFDDNSFTADVMDETIKRTTLMFLKNNSEVNLEKSLTLNDYLGGHLVLGDTETTAKITRIDPIGNAKKYFFALDKKYTKYIIEKGRVCIDGASLTVIDVTHNSFSVSLIPHTIEAITLGNKNIGDIVNIETDIVGKYLYRFMQHEEEDKKLKDILNIK